MVGGVVPNSGSKNWEPKNRVLPFLWWVLCIPCWLEPYGVCALAVGCPGHCWVLLFLDALSLELRALVFAILVGIAFTAYCQPSPEISAAPVRAQSSPLFVSSWLGVMWLWSQCSQSLAIGRILATEVLSRGLVLAVCSSSSLRELIFVVIIKPMEVYHLQKKKNLLTDSLSVMLLMTSIKFPEQLVELWLCDMLPTVMKEFREISVFKDSMCNYEDNSHGSGDSFLIPMIKLQAVKPMDLVEVII